MTDKEKYVLENYKIYSDGRIFSYMTNKFLKFRTDKDGYLDVPLIYNSRGDRRPFRVHRLVGLQYLDKPENYNVINHKDLDKQNNNVDNLEWSTVALNTQHGYDYGAYSQIKRIKCTEPNGDVHIFPSMSHASRYYGYSNPSTIQAILEGRRHNPISRGSRRGYYFEYTDESVTTIERIATTAGSD